MGIKTRTGAFFDSVVKVYGLVMNLRMERKIVDFLHSLFQFWQFNVVGTDDSKALGLEELVDQSLWPGDPVLGVGSFKNLVQEEKQSLTGFESFE